MTCWRRCTCRRRYCVVLLSDFVEEGQPPPSRHATLVGSSRCHSGAPSPLFGRGRGETTPDDSRRTRRTCVDPQALCMLASDVLKRSLRIEGRSCMRCPYVRTSGSKSTVLYDSSYRSTHIFYASNPVEDPL